MLLTPGRGMAPVVQSAAPAPSIDSSPKTVALFGDSISAQSTILAGNYTYYEAYGYMIALNYLTNSRYTFETYLNKGLSGDSTSNMDARKASDLAGLNADLVFVLGGTNDIGSSIPAATIQSNLSSIYDYITGTLGAKVVAMTILPRTGISAQQKTDLKNVNDWIRAQASSDIIIADAYSDFNDGNDEPLAGYTYDGLHPSPAGAFVMAQAIKQVLDPLYGIESVFDPNDAGNLLTNGDFSGTVGDISANFTGTLADGWKAYGYSNGTRTASKNSDGSQNITVSIPSGNNSTESVYLEWDGHVTSGYSVGDTLYGEIEIDVVNGNNVQWICLEIRDVGPSTLYYIGMDKRDSTTFMPISTMGRGILRSPKFAVQSGNTKIEYRLRIEMNASSSNADLNFNIRKARLTIEN